jgi:hypothetical protein
VSTVDIPSSMLGDLSDGSASFSLRLQNGVGLSISGPNNGAGLDFTQLRVVPEPSAWWFGLIASAGIGLVQIFKRRQA